MREEMQGPHFFPHLSAFIDGFYSAPSDDSGSAFSCFNVYFAPLPAPKRVMAPS